MQEFHQKNGKNWRKWILSPKGIEAQSSIKGNFSTKTLSFSQTGLVKPDYDTFTALETRSTRKGRPALVIGGAVILIWLVIIALNTETQVRYATNLFLALSYLAICVYIVVIARTKAKVRFKKIYFESGGYTTFYYRNPQEMEEVDGFIKHIDNASKENTKEWFLKRYKEEPYRFQEGFRSLVEKGVFTEEEYRNYTNAGKLITKNKVKN